MMKPSFDYFGLRLGCHGQHCLFPGTAELSAQIPSTCLGSALSQHLHLRTSCCLKGSPHFPLCPGSLEPSAVQGQRSHLPPRTWQTPGLGTRCWKVGGAALLALQYLETPMLVGMKMWGNSWVGKQIKMFATNTAEKSSGGLGTAWHRYRNTDHQGWVLPWELSLGNRTRR